MNSKSDIDNNIRIDSNKIHLKKIDKTIICNIGGAFIKFNKCKELILTRAVGSKPKNVFDYFLEGVINQGANVVDIGPCSDSMFDFIIRRNKGFVIKISRDVLNISFYFNGFPLEIEKDFISFILNNSKCSKIKGRVIKKNFNKEFLLYNFRYLKKLRRIKIIADLNNGVGCCFFFYFLKHLPIEVIKLNSTLKDKKHTVSYEKNIIRLQKKIIKENADFGFLLDEQMNRILFIDDKGNILEPEIITILISHYILKNKSNNKIMLSLDLNQFVSNEIYKLGGKPKLYQHYNFEAIKEFMKNEKCFFGATQFSQYLYSENNFNTSTETTLLYLLYILSNKNNYKLSDISNRLYNSIHKIKNFYYFGEFGAFNLELVGSLQKYFKNNPNKIIKVLTYPYNAKLLNYFFKVNIKGIPLNLNNWRDWHYTLDKNSIINIYNKGFANNLSFFSRFNNKRFYQFKDKPRLWENLEKPLSISNKRKKYISIFPRARQARTSANLNASDWLKIIDLINKYRFKIVSHGLRSESLELDSFNLIYPKDILDQIYYLNRSFFCISPDSGFAHFALNCNCDLFIIGKSYTKYKDYNPFNNKIKIVSKDSNKFILALKNLLKNLSDYLISSI